MNRPCKCGKVKADHSLSELRRCGHGETANWRELLDHEQRAREKAEQERDALRKIAGSVVVVPCKVCGAAWPHPSVLSTSPVCESCQRQERDALRKERDDLQAWKANQQRALIEAAVELVEARSPHDGIVDGIKWLRSQLATLTAEGRAEGWREAERRRFMQVRGRYLSWGIVGPCRQAGVMFTDDDGFGPYRTFECYERYLDHGWPGGGPVSDEVMDAAERAVIDNAIRSLAQTQPREEGR